MFIPGLLQTPDYTRSMLTNYALRRVAGETITRALATRRYRQEILYRAAPAQLHVLIDESAIDRQVGGARVMANQLEHLWR